MYPHFAKRPTKYVNEYLHDLYAGGSYVYYVYNNVFEVVINVAARERAFTTSGGIVS